MCALSTISINKKPVRGANQARNSKCFVVVVAKLKKIKMDTVCTVGKSGSSLAVKMIK